MKKSCLLLILPALMLVSCGKRSFNAQLNKSLFGQVFVEDAKETTESKYYTIISISFVAVDKGKDATKGVFSAKDPNGDKVECACISKTYSISTSEGTTFTKDDKVYVSGTDESATVPSVVVAFDNSKIKKSNVDSCKFYVGGIEVNSTTWVEVSF